MGLAAGANLNPERVFLSLLEPIHVFAPDIAGTRVGVSSFARNESP